jgi:hypothetical protein
LAIPTHKPEWFALVADVTSRNTAAVATEGCLIQNFYRPLTQSDNLTTILITLT